MRPRPGGGGGGGGGGGRGRFGRRKVCAFCVEKIEHIDYKDAARLRRYVTDRGKIEPRRKTGTCARHQRPLTVAIKRARHVALLPYTAAHARPTGAPPPFRREPAAEQPATAPTSSADTPADAAATATSTPTDAPAEATLPADAANSTADAAPAADEVATDAVPEDLAATPEEAQE
jgi:small subunit ribosomal protein S18